MILRFLIYTLFFLTACTTESNSHKLVKEGNVEVYYESASLEDEARLLGKMLDTLGYGKLKRERFQLSRTENTIHINMVADEVYFKDRSNDIGWNAISLLASMEIFPSDSVQLHITSADFSRKRSLEKIKVSTGG